MGQSGEEGMKDGEIRRQDRGKIPSDLIHIFLTSNRQWGFIFDLKRFM